jgi:G:T/U-mismatch repair DNA glycosylase
VKTKVNLSEYIHPKMDILFVALNAPENSNKNAHWFTNNLSFWNLLHKSGIITAEISNMMEGDLKVFGNTKINYKNRRIGVTDLCRDVVETNSKNIKINSSDVRRIIEILKTKKVTKLCLMHSKAGRAFRKFALEIKFNNNRYGKIGKLDDTEIFEVPFHNASIAEKEKYYKMLIN